MLALGVVEHLDVVEHILPGFGTGIVGSAPYAFPLEKVEEALGDSVLLLRMIHWIIRSAKRTGLNPWQFPRRLIECSRL